MLNTFNLQSKYLYLYVKAKKLLKKTKILKPHLL